MFYVQNQGSAMTLSIYAMTNDRVLHASDARISYGPHGGYRDNARKLMFYASPAARMVLSFSGLAELKTAESELETIEQWLIRIMPSLDLTTAYNFAAALLDRLCGAVESTALTFGSAGTRLCVVLA